MVLRKVDNCNISRLPCQSPDIQDDVEDPFEDTDLDDGLDPAMKEELDRWEYSLSFVLVWLYEPILFF